jgi:hypothetical protein
MLVPFVGWIVGVVLVFVSQAWSGREKVVGLLLALLPVMGPFLVVVAGSESRDVGRPVPIDSDPSVEQPGADSGLGPIEVAVLAFAFLSGLPSALYLGWRLRRRPRAA